MKRQDPLVSCHGKDKLDASRARKVAAKLRGGPGSAYHCTHCGHWHVGHHQAHEQRLHYKRPKPPIDNDEE